MIFCGFAFCAGKYTLDRTPTYINNINSITLKNGIYDELFVTKKDMSYTKEMQEEWDFDTILHAKFNGDLLAGNVNFALDSIDSVVIKRRIVGENNWISIIKVKIDKPEDFNFSRLDKYVRANTEYEYALVPVINGVEGNLNINKVLCEFEGIFIMEKDITYGSVADISMATTKNRPTSIINPLNSKYPSVITNGLNNYYSGNTSALFIEDKDYNYNWNFFNSRKYREDILDFLCNGKAKILKHFDGRMFLISVVDNPTMDESISNFYPKISFSWVEIGDSENPDDLYNNNLTDYNSNFILTEGGETIELQSYTRRY